MRAIARCLILAVGLAAAVPALAAETIQSVGLTFPDQIAGFKLVKRTDFPQKGLGVNVAYEKPGIFVRASVFVYDAGVSSIPSNLDAPVVRKHFDQIIDDVKSLERAGKVRVTMAGAGSQTTRFAGCGTQFLWRDYDMVLDGTTLKSGSYLTAVNNNFVKLRTSYRADAPEGQRDIDRFVAEISKFLARCK